MKESFLPKDYKQPSTSNYFKFQVGPNKFRIMSPAITGYEYFNTSNKPVRSPIAFDKVPDDIKLDSLSGMPSIKHFWAFIVYNYAEERLQILEITQKSIMGTIQSWLEDDDWSDPTEYDITVTKSGSGMDTEYKVVQSKPKEVPVKAEEAYATHKIRLEALFEGADPFKGKVDYPKEEISLDSVPF